MNVPQSLGLQGYKLAVDQQLDHLREEVVNHICQPVFTGEVDGIEIRSLHPAQPHEVHISL